ncbi:hypothetical protein [Wolbachia endosymbiont of Nilaparvata lugens]|uniref:hypothetical protein n=1 Tax=Wolbachia endosymbiont of Nilaparvata lugens TaxID=357143 RepID=UPI00117CD113|nr:hypothetical protein [Wolbachia endosymbiont of Nilaparvata lugens]
MPKIIQKYVESTATAINYFPGDPNTEKECFKWCKDNNGDTFHRLICEADCNVKVGNHHFPFPLFTEGDYSQKSTANNIKSTLENIGDSFHTLADSFSVL